MIVRGVLVFFFLMIIDVEANRHRDVALELLDSLYNLKFGGRVENVARSPQQKLQMLRDVATTNIDSLDCIVD